MKKLALFTLLALALSLPGFAQTYFYVDSISVMPPNLTEADSVHIYLSGDLSGGGVVFGNHTITQVGSDLNLEVNMTTSGGGGGGALIPTTELFTHAPMSSGLYRINLSGLGLGDFVTDTSQYYFQVDAANSSNELAVPNPEIRVYPNPAADRIFLELDQPEGVPQIDLLDLQMKQVRVGAFTRMSDRQYSLHLEEVPAGTYFVRIHTDGKVVIKKVIVD